MRGEPRDNPFREQRATARQGEGGGDAGIGQHGKALGDLIRRQVSTCMPIGPQRSTAFRKPATLVIGQREHAGFRIMPGAECGPDHLPSRIGGVNHPHIAGLRAIGVADQAVLIHGCAARIGDGRLFNHAHLPAGAGQRPSGAKPHDAGAENQGVSLCCHGASLCRFGWGMEMLVLSNREGQTVFA